MIERGCRHIFFGFPSELHTARAYYLHTYRMVSRVRVCFVGIIFSVKDSTRARRHRNFKTRHAIPVSRIQKSPVRIFTIII